MSQPPNNNNPVVDWWKDWNGRTPLVTRFLLQTLAVFYVISWFSSLSMAVINIPYYTVLKFELYRLILAPMFCNSILNLIFTFMCFTSMGTNFERSLGSVRFGWLIGLICLFTNIGFDVFCFLMALLGTYEALFFQCQGFWIILFGLIAIECSESSEPTRQLFRIPYQIPTPYYPLVLFGLFSILSGPSLGIAIGMGFGYAYGYGKVEVLRPSLVLIQSWEMGCLANFTTYPGFIPSGAAMGSGAWVTESAAADYSGMEAGQASKQSTSSSREETPTTTFPGGGHTLSHSSGGLSKDAARRARLAALEGGPAAAKRWPTELNTLKDMGYDEQLASQTLEECGGNLMAAVERLSSS